MRGSRLAAATVMAVLAGVTVACVPPSLPGGKVLSPGCYDDVVTEQPRTFYFDASAGDLFSLEVSWIERNGITVTDPLGNEMSQLPGYPDNTLVAFTTLRRYDVAVSGRHGITIDSTQVRQQYRLCVSTDEERGAIGLGRTDVSAVAGQRVTHTYEGTAGEVLNVAQSMSAGLGRATVELPTGQPLAYERPNPFGILLPVTGTYRIVTWGPGTLWLSHDVDGGPIGLGRTDLPALVPGQNVNYTYTATVGEIVQVGNRARESQQMTWNSPCGWTYSPNVTPQTSDGPVTISSNSNCGGRSVWVSNPRDIGPITLGSPVVVAALDPGQSAVATYAGTREEQIQIRTAPPMRGTTMINPDGTRTSRLSGATVETFDRYSLTTTGTHLLHVPQPDDTSDPFTLEIVRTYIPPQ